MNDDSPQDTPEKGMELEAGGADEADEVRLTLREFAQMEGMELGEGLIHINDGEEEIGDVHDPTPTHTHAWHDGNMTAPVYHGARMTLMQLCFTLVAEKLKHNLTNKFMERFLRLLSCVLLPAGNTCPRSWYMLKKLVGWRDVEEIEQHVCVNDCYLYPWLHSSQYHMHANDKCPTCNAPRFRTKNKRVGGLKFVPQKVFYYFGLHHTVQSQFFANPVWCSMRGKGREEFKHDFYSSPEAARLNAAVDGCLFHEDNSAYQIGMDFAEPFNTRSFSSGVVGVRCRDIPHAHRSKLAFCAPLAIIPGPKAPQDMAPYLQLIFQEIAIAGSQGECEIGGEGDRVVWVFECW